MIQLVVEAVENLTDFEKLDCHPQKQFHSSCWEYLHITQQLISLISCF